MPSSDAVGRLVTVADRDPEGVVETRDYGFDANTNRTTLTITPAGGTASTVTYTYDSADRLVEVTGGANPGAFGYDANGNTVTMPGVSLTWTGDNRVRTITTASATVAYGYDVLGRTRTRTDGTTTSLYHYGGDGDAPAWVQDGATTTRYVPGPAGLSAADVVGGTVTWPLTTPHGALWAHTDSAGEITATFAFDEYGVPLSPATGDLGLDRYGWLGRQQRETDPGSGLILMGVRVYAPTMGRFLSVDPIHGGSANDYDYTHADPINNYDLDGKFCVLGKNPDNRCRGGRIWRGFTSGTFSASYCRIVCTGVAYNRTGGVYAEAGFFGLRGPALMWTSGQPSPNVSTGGGVCVFLCLGGSRDQVTRAWSLTVGVTLGPALWGGNFGSKRLVPR